MAVAKYSTSLTLSEKLKELVTCAVCHELLNNPKVFPCLHSYCYECIVKLSKNECGLQCPECRAPVEIGHPPDFSVLPTNFFANNVLATLSLNDNDDVPNLLCDNCEEATVEKRCKDCMQFLCAPCVESHQRSRDTKDHVLLSKDELKANEPAENARAVKCSKHNELVKFYCDTCKETACMSCFILDHKQHNFFSLEASSAKAKEEIQNLIEKVEERVETISVGIKLMEEKSRDITARKEACNAQIETFFAQLQEKIKAEKEKMLAISETAAENQKCEVEASKNVLDLALSTCQNGVNFAKQSLENGNEIQLLDTKPTITCYLSNLRCVQDQIIPNIGNPVRFLKSESLSRELCRQLTTSVCSVEEVAVCPEKCEAKFSNTTVKVGTKSVIVVTCKDKNGRIISSGCGKDVVQPIFTGVQVKNLETSENEDGTHEISFVVNELGTFQFKAKINGSVAPYCSLEAEVKWEISAVHGSGYLRLDAGHMYNCMSGEGDVGNYCFRLGNTPITSGTHHWKVEVSHVVQNPEDYCFQDPEGPKFEVGVIEASDVYSEASIKQEVTKKWVYTGSAKKITNVCLNLDMGHKSLEMLPGGKYLAGSFRRKVYRRISDVVFPFFSVNCPHCSLTVVTVVK